MNSSVERTRPALTFVDIDIALRDRPDAATVHEILGTPGHLVLKRTRTSCGVTHAWLELGWASLPVARSSQKAAMSPPTRRNRVERALMSGLYDGRLRAGHEEGTASRCSLPPLQPRASPPIIDCPSAGK
jgi:hypothetical protein